MVGNIKDEVKAVGKYAAALNSADGVAQMV